MEFKHISVLLNESIDLLKVKPDGVYADGTLGGGGHSSLICSRLSEDGMLIGIDRDETALAAAGERLQAYSCRKELCHENFFNIRKVLNRLNIDKSTGQYSIWVFRLLSLMLPNAASAITAVRGWICEWTEAQSLTHTKL